jgi:hypothetical protein
MVEPDTTQMQYACWITKTTDTLRIFNRRQSYLCTGLKRPKKLRLPGFSEKQPMKVARLSSLRTGRLYHPGKISVLISVRG